MGRGRGRVATETGFQFVPSDVLKNSLKEILHVKYLVSLYSVLHIERKKYRRMYYTIVLSTFL
jgi:hypothetical protein